jgi:hypothetical protein
VSISMSARMPTRTSRLQPFSVSQSALPRHDRRSVQLGGDVSRIAAVIAGLALLPSAALCQGVEQSKSENIGPWEIEATFKADKFDRCSISRTLQDDVVASVVRTSDGLTLVLESPNWKLDRGKQYPVRMTLGPLSRETEVAAEPNSVSIEVDDKKFNAGLRTASALSVVGAGATIRVPLDKSTVALDRLDKCFEKNSRAIETNPFVEPKRQP